MRYSIPVRDVEGNVGIAQAVCDGNDWQVKCPLPGLKEKELWCTHHPNQPHESRNRAMTRFCEVNKLSLQDSFSEWFNQDY